MNTMQITEEDRDLFCQACYQVMEKERMQKGIGTLGEKTVHAVLKHYLDPREQCHERRCCGFVADILADGEIIEIQTRNFNKLRKKLEVFLKEYDVTIVYPIPAKKWVSWIDGDTGEVSPKRKSPKNGSYYYAFYELYKIKEFLTNPNLHLRLLLIDMEEYRMLNGWSRDRKRGSTRYDRMPIKLEDELMIARVEDYKMLLPPDLPRQFTSRDYGTEARLPLKQAQIALNVLAHVGAVKKAGRQGNCILYETAF